MAPIEVKIIHAGPSSGVNLTSDTILFLDLPYMNIHASRFHFSNDPGSSVNLISEYDSLPF